MRKTVKKTAESTVPVQQPDLEVQNNQTEAGDKKASKCSIAVNRVYNTLNDCIIIGLTGRTGSGCSTTAEILGTKEFENLELATPKHKDFEGVGERKAAIVYKYMQENWHPFTVIEASSIIFSFILDEGYDAFIAFLDGLASQDPDKKIMISDLEKLKNVLKDEIEAFFKEHKAQGDIKSAEKDKAAAIKAYYVNTIIDNKKKFHEILKNYSCTESPRNSQSKEDETTSNLYTYLMQLIGNNIRCSGHPYDDKFDGNHIYCVAERINTIIEIIREYNETHEQPTRICIDAIRNPYEAYYFKDLYKCFYLVSVGTDDSERRSRLSNEYNAHQLDSLDEREYPEKCGDEKMFYQQDIAKCLQISDIHLYNKAENNSRYGLLTENLVKYIALMLHPGLVTPSRFERCMQIAFTAKFNSGCLSRQVGAVITDASGYVLAVGWNDAPRGQIPCNLRSVQNYFSDKDENTYSEFEMVDIDFNNALKAIKKEYEDSRINKQYSLPYCFKDIYNGMKKDKNQVYTRALHAEENAFLQIAKLGGQGIQGGKLFVTASPCELCSKKAYQLGIKEIYYIDPYPGIAVSHVLTFGHSASNPELHLYYGAIGNAYVSLYTQRFAIKDELQLLSGVDVKNTLKNKEENKKSDKK